MVFLIQFHFTGDEQLMADMSQKALTAARPNASADIIRHICSLIGSPYPTWSLSRNYNSWHECILYCCLRHSRMASCSWGGNADLITSVIYLNDDTAIGPKKIEIMPPGSFLLSLTFLIFSFLYVKGLHKWVLEASSCQLPKRPWSLVNPLYTPMPLLNQWST